MSVSLPGALQSRRLSLILRAGLSLQVKDVALGGEEEGREQAGHGPWSVLPTRGWAPMYGSPKCGENQWFWPLPEHPLQCLEHCGERRSLFPSFWACGAYHKILSASVSVGEDAF